MEENDPLRITVIAICEDKDIFMECLIFKNVLIVG